MLREKPRIGNLFVARIACLVWVRIAAADAAMEKSGGEAMAGIDFEKFRLRRFVDHLISIGEVDIHDRPIALADISAVIEASPKATLFKDAGPEHFEIVGAVGGSRRRHAAAFGMTDERNLAQEFAPPHGEPAAGGRGAAGRRAGAAGGDRGRRRRSHQAAVPHAARL